MTANTPEAEPSYVAPYIGPVHTERSGKVELWPQQYKDALLSMHRKGWQARANLPLPQGDADKVDAERIRAAGRLMSNWCFNMAQRTGHTLDSDDTAALDKMRKEWDAAIDAARLTPGGQEPRFNCINETSDRRELRREELDSGFDHEPSAHPRDPEPRW